MKYLPLVWAALRRKPTRTLLTSLSIFMAFFLFGVLQGVNVGIGKMIDDAKVNRLLVTSRINIGTPLPRAHVARIAALPGVKEAVGLSMMFATYQRPNNGVLAVGTDIEALFRMYSEIMTAPPEQIAAAARLRSGAIVGRALARQKGWKIGDRIPLHALNLRKADGSSDWTFDIVGFYDRDLPDTAMWVVGNYDYLNEPRGAGKDTVFEIVVTLADPARTAQVAQAIDDLFGNSPNQTVTQTERDYIESVLSQVGDINFLVNGIVAAVLFTLLFLTANTMAQSVRERIPEFAVLKTLGFSDNAVQWLVLAEAVLLCGLAAVAGLAASLAVLPLITNRPGLGIAAMHVPHSVFAAGAAVALIVAAISGVPVARKARRLDIASALSGR
jgi:putative ABC transport system permease protein